MCFPQVARNEDNFWCSVSGDVNTALKAVMCFLLSSTDGDLGHGLQLFDFGSYASKKKVEFHREIFVFRFMVYGLFAIALLFGRFCRVKWADPPRIKAFKVF